MFRFFVFITILFTTSVAAQPPGNARQFAAKRTTASIKVDGDLNEAAWKEAGSMTDFVEWRPTPGRREDTASRTEVYLLYDNTSVYVGGYCYERTRDSISRELVGRDVVGVNDFVGVILDTYYDKINASGFYVTPYGEQFDAKYSNTGNNDEDPSWNAVWDSEAKIHADGWSFEMRIPYSALRFVSRDNQTWGLNITRRRNKTGQQYMWSPIDPKVSGFINQEGALTGIEKLEAPVRLAFSPYFSTYINHYPNKTLGVKDLTSSVNGGMDVKYGISNAFTLDMTLIPDFGQVQSDNHVLNLSPFEVKYNENRPFFTEGTELFNKGNLFYSRRIGGQPIHYWDAYANVGANEKLIRNPTETKLINATKISGRTRNGLGIGFFNAITKPMYGEIEGAGNELRKVQTAPLTNYNIAVLDQTLKNNSSVSFINTNVLRSGSDYDANVSAAIFNFNNKANTYNWYGKLSLSHLTASPSSAASTGYSHNLSFGKTGGSFRFQLGEELADEKYSINDMGILFNNNYIDHYLWLSFRTLKPGNWYNSMQVNYNAYHSLLYRNVPDQKINSRFQRFTTNVNANVQFKNLWWAGMMFGFVPPGNDFYEPRTTGYSFRSTRRVQFNPWVETNSAKKYFASFNYFLGLRELFHSPNHQLELTHRYRFSDKFSLRHSFTYNPATNDAGYFDSYYRRDVAGNEVLDANGNKILQDVLFSRRDLKTIENVLSAKFNFNNRSGITFRARHYWSKVYVKELYDLSLAGTLSPTIHTDVATRQQNFNIFNIDAVYTLQFAPGSFINIVWKDASLLSDREIDRNYFKNIDHILAAPQNNNLSVKIIYYLDYLKLRKT